MELGTKQAVINYQDCDPHVCDPDQGLCKATGVCHHDVLLQEEPGEPPMLLSAKGCVGCGDCVRVCPAEAITIQHG